MTPRESLLDLTVTIPVVDLYDFLMREERPMPDLNQATSVKRAKRGYRTVRMTLATREYEALAKMAEVETRTPDQQAAHMLRALMSNLENNARTLDARLSGAWGEDDNGIAVSAIDPEVPVGEER